MQHHLTQDAAQHVAVSLAGDSCLHRLGNRTAQGTGGTGMLLQDLAANLGGHGGAGGDLRAVGTHDLAAEGLLLIAHLDHEHLAVQAQIGTGHAQSGAPLTGAGFGGDALQTLLLGVIGLGDGRIQLVGTGGVVALELVIDLGGRAQLFLQAIGADQGRGSVHFVKVADFPGNIDIGRGIIQLLTDQFVAENRPQVVETHGLQRRRIAERGGLVFHVGPKIVPGLGHFVFAEIDLVGDFFGGFHGSAPFTAYGSFSSEQRVQKNASVSEDLLASGQKRSTKQLLRYHPN